MSSHSQKQRYTNGTALTSCRMSDLLPMVLAGIEKNHHLRPDLILAAWPDIIGSKLAPMTQAVSFIDGILQVRVKNSTLHSLLSGQDKLRILNTLKKKFPNTRINNIIFRIG